jgi:hypothetical protein
MINKSNLLFFKKKLKVQKLEICGILIIKFE